MNSSKYYVHNFVYEIVYLVIHSVYNNSNNMTVVNNNKLYTGIITFIAWSINNPDILNEHTLYAKAPF